MAHGLKVAGNLKLHQALHGYSDGHHQLALSTTLNPRDRKKLLALSDISGPGLDIADEGYLTGYPLAESGFFALGRTWAAPEMGRPGCVWTHTLLIDFSDLATIDDLTGLLGLFRRPSGADASAQYAKAASLSVSRPADYSAVVESWARQVIAGLYGMPRRRVVAGHFGYDVDRAVLSLWAQQWPKLRRRFRFCTFATADRSADGDSFDLQVVPIEERSVRTRFRDAVDAGTDAPSYGRWLDDAVQDLLHPDEFGLRTSFRRFGADIDSGRGAFRALCRLHRAIVDSRRRPSALGDAIDLLQEEIGSKQGRIAWETVATEALRRIESLDESSFDFVSQHLELVDAETLIRKASRVGRLIWRRNPGMLVSMLDDGGRFGVIVERTLAVLETSELITGLGRAPALRRTALAHRPDLVGLPAFWTELDSMDDAFQVTKDMHLEDVAIGAMIAARDDIAPRAVQEFGSRLVLRTLCGSWDRAGGRISTWLRESVGDSAVVADFLANESGVPKTMLRELTGALPPDAVPNNYGDDPWLVAWRRAGGILDESADSYMAAYLLSRALGQRSRCAGELAQISFERIHTTAADNQLTGESWRLLDARLPWSSSWFEWDRCHRLRVGIARLFVDRDLDPGVFAKLCEEDELFALVAKQAAKRKRGRNFLKRVHRHLEEEESAGLTIRGRMIREILR